jgi:transcriptional regulator with XRE-family HTH domain
MAIPDDPANARGALADLLRDLRDRSGMSGRTAARLAGFGQPKLSKIENGQLLPSRQDAQRLCEVYQAAHSERRKILDLLAAIQGELEPARVILRRGADRKQRQIGEIEAATRHQRSFDLGAVIGLLQTADYMRRVFSRRLSTAEQDKAIAARLERQNVLRDPAKLFTFVMTEGALRWRAGSGEAMAAQMEHIQQAALLPGVRVGIIPWTQEVSVFPGHEFHIYDDRLVIVGIESAMATFRDPRDIDTYLGLFARLEDVAAFGEEARRILSVIAEDYRRLGN